MTAAVARTRVWRCLVAPLVLVALVASCGLTGSTAEADRDPGVTEELIDAGLLVGGDLYTGATVDAWVEGEPEPGEFSDFDESLPSCANLVAAEPEPGEGLERGESSDTFTSDLDSVTSIGLLARNRVHVYVDSGAAEAAVEALSSSVLETCIGQSVDPEGMDSLAIDESEPSEDADGKRFTIELDDYLFFEGNDNTHRFVVDVARVGRVLIVTQLVYGGQYFDDAESDLDEVEDSATAATQERIEELTG